MRTNMKRLLAVLCGVVMLCNSGMGLIAHAEEIVRIYLVDEYREPAGENVAHGRFDIPDMSGIRAATLANCSIGISVNANGVRGSITTGSTVPASEIGMKNVKVEKNEGSGWVQVGKTMSAHNTNDTDCVAEVTTSSAKKGVLYRITCTHYAVLGGVTHELYNETDGVSY